MLRQRRLLAEFGRVQSARIEARRQRTYAKHEAALEARREALLAKEAQEQRHLQQQQEVRGRARRGLPRRARAGCLGALHHMPHASFASILLQAAPPNRPPVPTPLRPKTQLKLIQEEIKREEESLAAVRRADARRRAEAEAAEKALYYSLKAEHRDRQLSEVGGWGGRVGARARRQRRGAPPRCGASD
jgi:cell wall-associated NlpC family hydrolase